MALLFQIHQKLSQGFCAFWTRWPRKVARKEAEKAWHQEVTADDEPAIHAALDWQVPIFERRDPERIPHAATWLRGRRWDDEQPKTPTVNRPIGNVRPVTSEGQQQQDAMNQIQFLIKKGLSPEEAKLTVYRALGWIKEGQH